jgi:catechol 2,3-dioxygenase-like lactoylglutathione lyase family enzyme
MAITLNHTIVPARDKEGSARFFAQIFGLKYDGPTGHFAPVRVNGELTLDFDDADSFEVHHYAFHVSDDEFDAIFKRPVEQGESTTEFTAGRPGSLFLRSQRSRPRAPYENLGCLWPPFRVSREAIESLRIITKDLPFGGGRNVVSGKESFDGVGPFRIPVRVV